MSENAAESSNETNPAIRTTGTQYLFRGDDYYRKSDNLGFVLDSADALQADIQTVWEHVQDKENQSSRFVSFSERMAPARKFTKKNNIVKMSRRDLDDLQNSKTVRAYDPADVEAIIESAGKAKIRRRAKEVRKDMEKNQEILVEGQIPARLLQQTN